MIQVAKRGAALTTESWNRPIVLSAVMVIASALLISLGGCATPAQTEQMVPLSSDVHAASANSPFREAIAMDKVGGGEEPDPTMDHTNVGTKELKEALRLSLRKYGFLSTQHENSPFRLQAFLVDLRRPARGFTMVATSVIRYKLSRVRDASIIYDDIVSASVTKTHDDEFVGAVRHRLAIEGSIRANIAEFLGKLNSLHVNKPNDR